MAITSKPDLDNYLNRITEIERVILPASTPVKNPAQAPTDGPFWLHLARGQTLQKGHANQWVLTFSFRILLVRKRGSNALGDWSVEKVIMQDMIDVLWNFVALDAYRNLKTATYPDIQAGFDLDSVMISNQERWEGKVTIGDVTGSIHTLSFRHKMYNTI